MRPAASKLCTPEELRAKRDRLRAQNRRLAFTNGCFDLLHEGHVRYLEWARSQGDALAVGLNGDASIRRLKGAGRPIVPQGRRAIVLAALEAVDYVCIFDEDEPRALIEKVLPQVLVKGRDWAHYVSGRETVEAHGGRVALAPLVEGLSTSEIVQRIRGLEIIGDDK